MARVKFLKGKQRFFLDSAGRYFQNDWKKVARFLHVNERTLRDWRCEKYTMNHASLINLNILTKVSVPQGIEILEDYWSAKKHAWIGAQKRFQIYGNPATPEGRRKGGLTTQRLIRKNPKLALESGIIVRKKIHDPRHSLQLAEFIGIMLGDGGVTNYQLNITLNSETDKEYIVYVKSLLERLFCVQAPIMLRKKKLLRA